jgi:hypothetical protein
VHRTITFNADHSGSIENKVDMSSVMAMMNENGGGAGAMGNMGDMAELDKTKAMFEGISGISNVKVSYDTTGIIYNSYDFNSTEALVAAMSTGSSTNSMMLGMGEMGTSNAKIKMTYKGKKFFFEEVDKKTLKSLQSEKNKQEIGEMDMMLASSKMITTINFPVAVKKISYKNASITNDKSVTYEMPIKDYMSINYKPLTISLK